MGKYFVYTYSMQPLGNHIQINPPEELTKSSFILEKEALAKAVVLKLSPDIKVPFKENDTVYFYTGRHIIENGYIFVNLEMVQGFSCAN